MLCKARQVKHESVQVYAERLYALANDSFAKVGKAVGESLLVGFFIHLLYYDFLPMKVMRENPKNISGCSTICIGRTKFARDISIRSNDHDHPKGSTVKTMEIDPIRHQDKMFLMLQGGCMAKHCRSKSVNAIVQVGNKRQVMFAVGDVEKWVT